MAPADSERAIREFMDAHPDIDYATALALSEAPHRFAVADRRWTDDFPIPIDWLDEPTIGQYDDLDGKDWSWASLGQTLASALDAHYLYEDEDKPGVEGFENGRFLIAEMVCHQGRWLVWRKRRLAEALGPDGVHALALYGAVKQDEFVDFDNPNDDYVLYDFLCKMAFDTLRGRGYKYAEKALLATYGTGSAKQRVEDIGFEPLQCGEFVAVLARHLIGRYDYWTQAEYDMATLNFRSVYGRLHPGDPKLRRVTDDDVKRWIKEIDDARS